MRLTQGKKYEVLGIEADHYRILTDDSDPQFPNSPCLYEPECFRVLDNAQPAFWVKKVGEDGELYAYPKEWSRAGFFEDYHEYVEAVRTQFWSDLSTRYPWTSQERAPERPGTSLTD